MPMPRGVAHGLAWLLIAVHAGLAAWALTGFAELLLASVPWTRISNPLFSRSMLLTQWLLVLTAALVFIIGYATRWRATPRAMLVIYGAMAGVCAYQTFFILTSPWRFQAMALEYAEYVAILTFLHYSTHMRQHFS